MSYYEMAPSCVFNVECFCKDGVDVMLLLYWWGYTFCLPPPICTNIINKLLPAEGRWLIVLNFSAFSTFGQAKGRMGLILRSTWPKHFFDDFQCKTASERKFSSEELRGLGKK